MKKLTVTLLCCFLAFHSFSQEPDQFKKLWDEIEKLRADGLNQSAIDKTGLLIEKAKKEGKDDQYVKGQIYRMYFRGQKEEESFITSISEMESEIENSQGNRQAILHSALAEMYWWFYTGQQWQISQRTPSDDLPSEDIREWDSKHFVQRIHHHYQASLKFDDFLKKTDAGDFDLIWINGEEGRNISPTLYDVLVKRAIEFYSHNLSGLTLPKDQIYVDDHKYFLEAQQFINLEIKTTDYISFDRISLSLYQDLLKFHLAGKNVDALAYYDMSRLNFIYGKYLFSNRDSLYKQALTKAFEEYKSSEVSSEIAFSLAQQYQRLSNRYHYKNLPEYRGYNKTALEWCKKAQSEFPESRGAAMAGNMEKSIKETSFFVEIENVNYPGSPISYAINYKNISTLYFRLYNNSENILIRNSSRNNEQNVQYFLKKKAIQSWQLDLLDSLDYQSHGMEFKMAGLKAGNYILLVSENADFKTVDNLFELNFFCVSSLAYLYRQDNDGGSRIIVTDRMSGKALEGIRANYYKEQYNHSSRSIDLIEQGELFSNKEGRIDLPSAQDQKNFRVLLSKGKDSLMISNPIYVRKVKNNNNSSFSTSFFTDRNLYRPGQTVYFKGLVMERNADQEVSLVTDRQVTVKLMDVNSQEVGRLDVKTSSFGTYSGHFFLPASTLTGRFFLDDGISRQAIFVEEYKRPSFQVELEKIKENIRLGESVVLSGNAKSFNNVPLGNAKGSFSIQRYVHMGIPYHGYGYLPMHKTQIAFGDFICDEEGNFKISFEALPDKALPANKLPIFQFTAEVMISDLNGESQQAEISIPIGYHSLNLSMLIQDELDKDHLDSVEIITQNLSGVFTSAEVDVKVISLIPPAESQIDMLWNTPDYSLPKDEKSRSQKFYKDEQNMEDWPLNEAVLSKRVKTVENVKISLSELKKVQSGPYEIHLKSTDPFGKEVNWSKRISIFSNKDKNVPVPLSLWTKLQTTSCIVGEEAVLLIGSNNAKASAYYSVSNKDGIYIEEWLSLDATLKEIRIPVEEKDRGGLSIQIAMIANGKSYLESHYVSVPFDNKKLNVKLSSYRDKLKPGNREIWNISIRDKGNKIVNAEVLASMYDASLDKLRKFNWHFSPFYRSASRVHYYSGNNFSVSRSRTYPFKDRDFFQIKPRNFDQLNWFGFSYHGGLRYFMSANGGDVEMDGVMTKNAVPMSKASDISEDENLTDQEAGADNDRKENVLRNDFREMAFFYPRLIPDDSGNVELSFEVPHSLTKWKLQVLAHTEDLKYGLLTKEFTSSKELMVVPNYPRFLVAGDTLVFSAKLSNLTDSILIVESEINISNALNNNTLASSLLSQAKKKIEIKGKSNEVVQWKMIAPDDAGMINIAVFAESKNHYDGEVRSIPILSNEILVTETYPISLRGGQMSAVKVDKLSKSSSDLSIKPKRLTVEFTSNPSWYVVQALPYISQINNESCDQLFNKYYANSIGRFIMKSNPAIKEVIDIWSKTEPDAFLSNLEKNEELKQMVLNESPWLLEAQAESTEKREIALFFDENNLENSLNTALYELLQSQLPNGAWPWFKGMVDNQFVTQNIVLGLARLDRMKVISIDQNGELKNALSRAISFLDERMQKEYQRIIKRTKNPNDNHLNNNHIEYLFMRSFFLDQAISEDQKPVIELFENQCEKYWLEQSNYTKAMMALAFYRKGKVELTNKIIASLRENALHSEEFGMYWKLERNYYLYHSVVESQAMIIEAFTEIDYKEEEIEELTIYLLKQKQTKRWHTGKASVDACYALLMKGNNNLTEGNPIAMTVGDQSFEFAPANNAQSGTGYFKSSWTGGELKYEMSEISVENKGKSISWGAVYYQFFQDADKVESASAGLEIQRDFYVKRYTEKGELLKKISGEVHLERGDVVVVKMIIKSDRAMSFVHLKDMRAAGLEPVDFTSGYRYKAGMGYYLSIKDASTNFYFNLLNKGSYNLEYELKAVNSGIFSSGIAQIQNFYSPEFSSHSKGQKIEIK